MLPHNLIFEFSIFVEISTFLAKFSDFCQNVIFDQNQSFLIKIVPYYLNDYSELLQQHNMKKISKKTKF